MHTAAKGQAGGLHKARSHRPGGAARPRGRAAGTHARRGRRGGAARRRRRRGGLLRGVVQRRNVAAVRPRVAARGGGAAAALSRRRLLSANLGRSHQAALLLLCGELAPLLPRFSGADAASLDADAAADVVTSPTSSPRSSLPRPFRDSCETRFVLRQVLLADCLVAVLPSAAAASTAPVADEFNSTVSSHEVPQPGGQHRPGRRALSARGGRLGPSRAASLLLPPPPRRRGVAASARRRPL